MNIKQQVIKNIKEGKFYNSHNENTQKLIDSILESYTTNIFVPEIIQYHKNIIDAYNINIDELILMLQQYKNKYGNINVSTSYDDTNIMATLKRKETIEEITYRVGKKLINDFIIELQK